MVAQTKFLENPTRVRILQEGFMFSYSINTGGTEYEYYSKENGGGWKSDLLYEPEKDRIILRGADFQPRTELAPKSD